MSVASRIGNATKWGATGASFGGPLGAVLGGVFGLLSGGGSNKEANRQSNEVLDRYLEDRTFYTDRLDDSRENYDAYYEFQNKIKGKLIEALLANYGKRDAAQKSRYGQASVNDAINNIFKSQGKTELVNSALGHAHPADLPSALSALVPYGNYRPPLPQLISGDRGLARDPEGNSWLAGLAEGANDFAQILAMGRGGGGGIDLINELVSDDSGGIDLDMLDAVLADEDLVNRLAG